MRQCLSSCDSLRGIQVHQPQNQILEDAVFYLEPFCEWFVLNIRLITILPKHSQNRATYFFFVEMRLETFESFFISETRYLSLQPKHIRRCFLFFVWLEISVRPKYHTIKDGIYTLEVLVISGQRSVEKRCAYDDPKGEYIRRLANIALEECLRTTPVFIAH
jgi:hypothetical protein